MAVTQIHLDPPMRTYQAISFRHVRSLEAAVSPHYEANDLETADDRPLIEIRFTAGYWKPVYPA